MPSGAYAGGAVDELAEGADLVLLLRALPDHVLDRPAPYVVAHGGVGLVPRGPGPVAHHPRPGVAARAERDVGAVDAVQDEPPHDRRLVPHGQERRADVGHRAVAEHGALLSEGRRGRRGVAPPASALKLDADGVPVPGDHGPERLEERQLPGPGEVGARRPRTLFGPRRRLNDRAARPARREVGLLRPFGGHLFRRERRARLIGHLCVINPVSGVPEGPRTAASTGPHMFCLTQGDSGILNFVALPSGPARPEVRDLGGSLPPWHVIQHR